MIVQTLFENTEERLKRQPINFEKIGPFKNKIQASGTAGHYFDFSLGQYYQITKLGHPDQNDVYLGLKKDNDNSEDQGTYNNEIDDEPILDPSNMATDIPRESEEEEKKKELYEGAKFRALYEADKARQSPKKEMN